MTLAEIYQRARTFETKVRRRNAREYIACAIVILAFLPVLFHRASWMMQAGGALTIAATVIVAWQLHRRGAARRLPEGDETLVAFHREELMRQRDALRSIGRWYLAPFIPGMILLLMGRWFQSHAPHRPVGLDHLIILLCSAIVALVFLVIWLLNQRGADRLQRRIDQL
jgi:hypothetical protein